MPDDRRPVPDPIKALSPYRRSDGSETIGCGATTHPHLNSLSFDCGLYKYISPPGPLFLAWCRPRHNLNTEPLPSSGHDGPMEQGRGELRRADGGLTLLPQRTSGARTLAPLLWPRPFVCLWRQASFPNMRWRMN